MHSGQVKRFSFGCWLALLLLVVLVGAVSTTTGVDGGQEGGAVKVLSTSQAAETLQQDNDSGGALDSLLDWLGQYQQLEETRQQRRTEIYERNIAQAKDALARDNVTQALTFARKASSYAPDIQQFQQLEWLEQIVARAQAEGQEYQDKHEWLDAGNVYAELGMIFKDNKQYRQIARRCGRHARLEIVYKPDGQWEEDLANISPDVVAETIVEAYRYSVEVPDLQALTISGLEAIRTLVQTEKLSEVFPELEDQANREEFARAIDDLISRAEQQTQQDGETFGGEQVYQLYGQLLGANDRTCKLPQPLIIKEFVDGMLEKLDKFSSVIWPSEREDFQKMTTGQFSGVGISITMEDNKLKVITPLADTPAYRAGIAPGDIITAIDGKSTQGITINKAVRTITGPKGTKVVLTVLHTWDENPVDVPLIRDTIVIHTVKGYRRDQDGHWWYFIDPEHQIAYVKVTSFNKNTVDLLKDVLRRLSSEGMEGLILDLRFNAGGLLRSAVDMADLFLGDGVIVSTRGRSVESYQETASPGGPSQDVPMVVLINDFSASASEIVAGALKDHGRALLVGQRTYGKGSVQNVMPIANNSCWLKLTTALYYLPSGRSIHKREDSEVWGVDPDIEIKLTPNEIRDVVKLGYERDIINQHNDNEQTNSQPASKPSSLPDNLSASMPVSLPSSIPTSGPSSVPTSEPTSISTSGPSSVPTSGPTTTAAVTSMPAEKEYPPVDVQLEAALLLMRTKLHLQQLWPVARQIIVAQDKSSESKILEAVQP